MNEMKLRALAKINLGLDVLGCRDDGYHEVKMIMQTVFLYDRILLRITKKPGIQVKTNLSYVPSNENNLAYKAAKLLMEEFDIKSGIWIDIKKYIPVAAGMAGGSTDAAAVLVGMNKLCKLGLTKKELMKFGVKLGADVPYCIMRGTALAEGIGEELTRLPAMPDCKILIAKPPISVSTKFVYDNLVLDETTKHPDMDVLIDDLKQKDLAGLSGHMGNLLETVTIEKYPVIQQIKQVMMDFGSLGAMMSGSGPTVFGIFEEETKAQAALDEIRKRELAKQLYITRPYNL
ncbi:MAG: 4-(cytidine 5'-diphospho)-2-C-methyl-D-erythritol kinase [Lachnospiraceae bacterium]|nr:4-(cytidine 5'-diphospho)-2-C-methyl-D-erythritol kinase [Lachnospiraceae bacterium]